MTAQRPSTTRTLALRHLKEQARLLLALREADGLIVSELRCSEPGCPPLETVIGVLPDGASPWQLKIHKPLEEVDAEDLKAALAARSSSP